ncbi:MAG TPA: alpha-ketoacid dehydrogenase subunit beta [Terriglobales bacterium]|jgi:pyruvate dehydrogenase E1 component beta subunit
MIIKKAMHEALNMALREEMIRDPRVVLLGEEIGPYNGVHYVTRGLFAEFGKDRVIDTPISEESFVGVGVGMAMMGQRPVVELMRMDFCLRAMDQIYNHMAKIRYMSGGRLSVPMVLRGPEGPGPNPGLTAQHGQQLTVLFAHCPGLRVVSPANQHDAKGMLKAAIRCDDPVVFLEPGPLNNKQGDVDDGDYLVPLDQAEIKHDGSDVTLIGYGASVSLCLQAARELERGGVSAEVVDMRSLRPLDMAPALASVAKTNRAVVVDYAWQSYGPAAEIVSRLMSDAFWDLESPVLRVAGKESPLPYAANLEELSKPNVEEVVAAAKQTLRN